MARPRVPVALTASGRSTLAGSASVVRPGRRNPRTDRSQLAQPWQREAYRHVNICGEARYAATLFAAKAGRAELGIAPPQSLRNRAAWINEGEEVDALAELAPTVRDRAKLIRDFMIHRTIAGEAYLIARPRLDTDPEYETRRTEPVWEWVAVTELQKNGDDWKVRHENGNYVDLVKGMPVLRWWSPDPENRMEAWSPFRSLLPTLREIEYHTAHIFTQVQSRLKSAGVWFLPNNLTFPEPPPDAVVGGAEAIAGMNDAERLMASLAASATQSLEMDEVAFPTVMLADPTAMEQIDQTKLIQFWSTLDDKAMLMRSDAVRRFALGMDMPPEAILGSSGLAVSGTSGSAGSVNHWGEWAKQEETIQDHVEPGLDDLVGFLTTAVVQVVVEDSINVVAYDTSAMRHRQDRSKESMELYDRGELAGAVMLKENGFDPETDSMDDAEFRRWILKRIATGSATPEQVQSALQSLAIILPPLQEGSLITEAPRAGTDGVDDRPAPGISDRSAPPSLEGHPYEGPPRVQHDHSPAPYSLQNTGSGALTASCEGLVLRALEKAGNRLLNDGKRGRDKDRSTPAIEAHVRLAGEVTTRNADWDFSTASIVLSHVKETDRRVIMLAMSQFCSELYESGTPYTREALIYALRGL